jgi:hypothetical protein
MRSRLLSVKDEFVTFLLEYLRYRDTTTFYESNQSLAFLAISLHVIISPHLRSSNHKSTQTCLHHYLDGFEDWSQEFPQDPKDDC